MATNLVSLIMSYLTPDMIGRIASALGLDRHDASSAIEAGVPGLLAAFAGVATRPGGPQKLAEAAKQEVATLDKLTGTFGTAGQTSLLERGSQMLGSVLGDREQAALATAIGKYSGVGTAAGSSLLGGLGPLVMSAIAQQQGPRALDGGSIASLLASQKDNIMAALPSSFGKLLGGSGLFNTIDDAARRTAAAGGEATRAAAASVARTVDDTRRSAAAMTPGTNWLLWLIPALAIAALVVWLLGRPAEQAMQQTATGVQSLTVGGLDLGKQVSDSIGNLRTSLAGITDEESARAALPKIQAATAQIDKVDGMIGQLSDTQKKALAAIVVPVMPTLNQLFDKVLAIPGVADVVRPAIDTLKAKLAVLTA
jgi:hypothetical protein